MEHTKEPWKVNGDEVGYISDNDDQSFGMFCPVGVIYEPANARRIVACVNACAGIPTEKLDGIAHAIGERAAELIAMAEQRDELLAALEKLCEAADDSDGCQYGTLATHFVRDIARAAIAKVQK